MKFDELRRDDPPGCPTFERGRFDDPIPQFERTEPGGGERTCVDHARTVPSTRQNGHVDLEQFYDANPARRHSEELEFGSDWSDAGARTQVSWVEATGELYAMRAPLGTLMADAIGDTRASPVSDEDLTVQVLGIVLGRDAIAAVMSGWPQAMVGENSLAWVRERIANAENEMNDPPAAASRDLSAD